MDGRQLRDARNRAGLTQEQLSAQLGVTLRTVGNWERGQTIPRDRLPALRDLLGPYLGSEPASALASASDAALLAEIARRFERGKEPDSGRPPIAAVDITTPPISVAYPKAARRGTIDPGDAGPLDHIGEHGQEE